MTECARCTEIERRLRNLEQDHDGLVVEMNRRFDAVPRIRVHVHLTIPLILKAILLRRRVFIDIDPADLRGHCVELITKPNI